MGYNRRFGSHYIPLAVLGGELPTNRGCGLVLTLVISMGFLWGQVVHLENWGELTHLLNGINHQVGVVFCGEVGFFLVDVGI